MGILIYAILSTTLLSITLATPNNKNVERDQKLVSVFQVVKFKNDLCAGSSGRNGTCFTSAECDDLGGTSQGTCADGFGVCCILSLATASTTSLNNSYINPTVFNTGSSVYKICPCSDSICRIKLDFTSFILAGPNSGIGSVFEGAFLDLGLGVSVGSCVTDTFQIKSPCGASSPMICGTNTNQHMILDVGCGTECLELDMTIGASTAVTRALDIKIIQYDCGDHDVAGPPGCLQYFQNSSGKIRSFNFPDVAPGTTIDSTPVHLSNQHYRACVRRDVAMEAICFTPCTSTEGENGAAAGNAVTKQPSFGLSISPNAESKSGVGSDCSQDYIWISNAMYQFSETEAGTVEQNVGTANLGASRFCGRYLASATSLLLAGELSICSWATPFVVGVEFDSTEICTANTDPSTCESLVGGTNVGGGGGITGFSICYKQVNEAS